MALYTRPMLPFPVPSDAETTALQATRDYLTRAGTQAASQLLGCPPPNRRTEMVADLSESLLAGASLIDGLLDLLADYRRYSRIFDHALPGGDRGSPDAVDDR